MRNILILGAGKSSVALIDYLIKYSRKEKWIITVADITEENALQKTKRRINTVAVGFDLNNSTQRKELIKNSDIVISMLPASLHIIVAKDCLKLRKNLVTPSYVSEAMRELDTEVKRKGLIFMNEMGLDPGIDHMSSMQLIDNLKDGGNEITGYLSHCGGLVAPESDNNPWHYKFTWNPRNVILAGQGAGGIQYLKQGKKIKLKYEKLFDSATPLKIPGYGKFESYPNRDSLKYIDEYGLKGVKTMYRGTLRISPFCEGWSLLVDLGLTKEEDLPKIRFMKQFVKRFSILGKTMSKRQDTLLKSTGVLQKLYLSEMESINPAKFMQEILERNWAMHPKDKDMIVMVHQLNYKTPQSSNFEIQSSLVFKGKNSVHTAMATTVGLPVAMVTRLILNGQISQRGVLMPKHKEVYEPILNELKDYGISFTEKITRLALPKKKR
ncbi:MAG: saccharopine dehydrogenase C-terminal domain-containing protein [Chitinophagales bacterium]